MVVINVPEIRVEIGVEFNSDEREVGIWRGVGKAHVPMRAAERLGIGGDEKGDSVAEGAKRGGDDGEGESRGERSGGIGGEIKKANGVYVEGGSDAGRGRGIRRKGKAVEFLSEKNGVVSEMGVTGEGNVLIGQERERKRGRIGEDQEEEMKEEDRGRRRVQHHHTLKWKN